MHTFICRIVLCIVLYFLTTLESLLSNIFSVHLVPLASRILKILSVRETACVYRRLLDLSPCIVLFLEYFDTLLFTFILH